MNGVSVGAARKLRGAVLVPLIVTRQEYGAAERGLWLHAQRCAAAVLIKERGGALRAFAVDGTERDAQALMAAFPDIARVLAAAEG